MLRALARLILKIVGWKLGGPAPKERRAVVIAEPHTSNWDGFYMIVVGFALGVKFAWIGKNTLFRGPLGPLLRALGGVPIDRSGKLDLVTQLAREFESRDELLLAIAPEGTRSRRDFWRSGFYHIARAANVPIQFGYLDYGRKCGGISPGLSPSGDPVVDMERIRAFYSDITPKHPERYGPIRLREELDTE